MEPEKRSSKPEIKNFWLIDVLKGRDIEGSDFTFDQGSIIETSNRAVVRLAVDTSAEAVDAYDCDPESYVFNVFRGDLIVFAKKVNALFKAKSLTDINKFYLALDEEYIIIGWRPALLQFAEAIENFEKELQEKEKTNDRQRKDNRYTH